MNEDVLNYIRLHPACLSRDIASFLGMETSRVANLCARMHRDGLIERNAGLQSRWTIRPRHTPSILVNGNAYKRWDVEAKRRGVPLQQLVAQALESI